jgi:hypothetical protein
MTLPRIFKRYGDSAVGMGIGYGLYGQGFGVRVPAGARFSDPHVVSLGPGAHPMDTRDPSPGVKWPERETDHSPASSAEVKNT